MIYFGCDAANVSKCRKIIEKTIDSLCQHTLSDYTFDKIKRQYCGQLLASSDHIENRAMSMGKSVLYFNKIHDISNTARRIMDVSAKEMREVAEEFLSKPMSVLTLT